MRRVNIKLFMLTFFIITAQNSTNHFFCFLFFSDLLLCVPIFHRNPYAPSLVFSQYSSGENISPLLQNFFRLWRNFPTFNAIEKVNITLKSRKNHFDSISEKYISFFIYAFGFLQFQYN